MLFFIIPLVLFANRYWLLVSGFWKQPASSKQPVTSNQQRVIKQTIGDVCTIGVNSNANLYTGFLILLAGIFLSSCANINFVKRKYMPGYYVNKSLKIETADNEKYKEIFWDDGIAMNEVKNIEWQAVETPNGSASLTNHLGVSTIQIIPAALIQKNKPNNKFNNYPEECDEVILMNGDIIKVKVTEIGIQEIIYRDCDNLDGPDISILRADVFMIKYANGTKELFNTGESKANISNISDTKNATTDGYAIASLVTGILAVLNSITVIGGIIFGILGIIFGTISIRRIKENPDKYKGNSLAVTGKVTGVIAIVLSLFFVIFLILALSSIN